MHIRIPELPLCATQAVTNSPQEDNLSYIHLDTLFGLRVDQSLHLLFNSVCLAEKQQFPI